VVAFEGDRIGRNVFISAIDFATWGTTITDLVPGQAYTVTYVSNIDSAAQIDVFVDTVVLRLAKVPIGGRPGWAPHAFSFTAQSTTANLALMSSCPGIDSSLCTLYFDAFSISPVNDVVGC
jgi:hypothetical protein